MEGLEAMDGSWRRDLLPLRRRRRRPSVLLSLLVASHRRMEVLRQEAIGSSLPFLRPSAGGSRVVRRRGFNCVKGKRAGEYSTGKGAIRYNVSE